MPRPECPECPECPGYYICDPILKPYSPQCNAFFEQFEDRRKKKFFELKLEKERFAVTIPAETLDEAVASLIKERNINLENRTIKITYRQWMKGNKYRECVFTVSLGEAPLIIKRATARSKE